MPPHPLDTVVDARLWPFTKRDDWCGEHARRGTTDVKVCANCDWWGDKWVADLARECTCPEKCRSMTGVGHTCGYWKQREKGRL